MQQGDRCGLADSDGVDFKSRDKKHAKVHTLHILGICRVPADLSLADRDCVKPDSQRRDDSAGYRLSETARDTQRHIGAESGSQSHAF